MTSRSVAPVVERLLKDSPALRNSDKDLLLTVWHDEGLRLSDEQRQAFMNCTPAESITRARRALRSKYPGDEVIENERYRKMVIERDEYGMPVMVIR